MSEKLNEHPGDTVRLLRPPPRVFTDPVGGNIWMGDVEVVDLELVNTEISDPYNSVVDVTDPWANSN